MAGTAGGGGTASGGGSTADPFDLERFVRAQEPVWSTVVAELRAGRKRSHWMWFVFPQLRGLGRSEMAERYGISGLAEARAYLSHPELGPRLRECAGLLLAVGAGAGAGASAVAILGDVDAQKLRSSMTLFELAAEPGGEAAAFAAVLGRFFGGHRDEVTIRLLRAA